MDSEDSPDFILVASQEESQAYGRLSPATQMKKILTSLPALQDRGNCRENIETRESEASDESPRGEGSKVAEEAASTMSSHWVASGTSRGQHVSGEETTQGGQASGYLHNLFGDSQDDMFSDQDDSKGDRYVATPAEHLGSLQLSQNPMLVPETVDESTENEIPPSPDSFSSAPCIIPNSPTDQSDDSEDNNNHSGSKGNKSISSNSGSSDFMADNTLVSESQQRKQQRRRTPEEEITVIDLIDSSADIDGGDDIVASQSHQETQNFTSRLAIPTVVGSQTDSARDSLSHNTSNSVEIVDVKEGNPDSVVSGPQYHSQGDVMWHLNAVSSQKLLQSSKALKNNAVIPLEPDGVIDSEECRLKLSPSQSGSTQGQGKRSSEGQISRSSDVLIIDTLSVTSHTETTTVAKMVKSASQGASIGYAGSACLINDRRSSSAPRSVEEIRSSRKRQKELLAISSNPLVIWKNEDSDIGKFHLETPRDSHMTDTPVSQGAVSIATSDAALTAEHVPVLRSETRDVVAGDPIISMPACATVDKLSISMIQSESESTTQPMFRLERPIMEESEDIIEEVVVARKPMSANRRRRVIEDDSDEDIKTDQTTSGYHHATNEQLNNTLEQEETFNLSSGQYLATKIGPTDNVEAMADETQNYVVNEQDCCLNDLKTSLGEGIDTAYNELTQRDNVVSEAKNDENIGESEKRVTESATQTTENKPCVPFEDVDMNIVQKVTEYLTGTYQRSGSNSTCTDLSDLHADGSEKGESGLKSPQLTTPGKSGTLKSRSRRESTEQRSPKSPHEIQTIIQTYSNILQKSVKKQQERKDSVLASSQTFTNQGEFVERSSIPRRLSTQSLPEHLLRPGSSYVSLQQHSTTSQLLTEEWMSPRRPTTQTCSPKENGATKPGYRPSEPIKQTAEVSKPVALTDNKAKKSMQSTDKFVTSVLHGERMEKIAEEIQNENIGFVLSQNDNAQVTPGIENENYQSVPINTKSDLNKTAYNGANTKTKPFRPQVSNTQINSTKLTGITPTERLTRGKRKKKLIPAGKRNELRKESCSPKDASGTFVAATQKFGAVTGADPYRFTSTQSQNPEEHPRTPVSSRKRSRRLLHKKSGLKKLKIDASAPQTSRHQITSPVLTSQSSDVSVTTIGSLSSIPSSISQSSPRRETTLLLSSGSSRQSVTDEITTRLSGKRLSIEQSLPDTLPLPHSEEENYQQVHVVIEKVERVYREITTTRRVISLDGQVLDCTKEVKRLDPVVVEETTHKKVQYLYLPSPSRSGQSMTSGDLGDISSSLSKSSVSSGSLGSKVSLTSPSLDHAGSLNPLSNHLDMQGYGDKGQSRSQRRESLEEIKKEQPIQKTSNTMEAPKLVPAKHPSLSTHEAPKRTSTSSKSSSHPTTPEVPASKSVTPVVQSDQDSSGVGTPLGSTINKTGSYLHSRTVSIESPRTVSMNSPRTANINSPHTVSVNNPVTASMNSPHTSESLFSSSSDDNRKKLEASKSLSDKDPSKSVDTETASTSKAGYNESKQISEVSPQQDQAVSSSGTPPDTVTMVTSSGDTGCRVLAKWKDGFFYPGCLKSTPDRYTKCSVKFDDGDRMNVRSCDILLIERLAPGQSVMVLTPAGDFEYGLVLQQHSDGYVVETDDSKAGRYSFSQVILSTDQAACIVSDMGSVVLIQGSTNPGAPRDVGQVSLENIVDTPRRSAKKKPPEEVKKEDTEVKGQGQTTRGLKRKLDSLQPQATSTPTPKGKGPLSLSKQQKVSVTPSPSTSPIRGIQDSPRVAATSPRKTRVGLFPTGLGPLPGARLFEGIHFLLTHVEKTPQQVAEEKEALKPALDTSTDESSADEEPCTPFNKDHLKTQIEAGGGVVVEDLTEELMSSGRRVVLLSSTYQRTLKYLQCLAGGVPCISHMWVVDSCTAQELLNETIYLLPAGISLEKHRLMEWNKRNDVFIGIKAVVHSKNTRFVDSWSAILKLGKCQVYPQQQLTDVHVMVTDSTCSPALERQARKKEVPLVSTEWVIQSLINGKVAGYDVHPKYRHDFSV